MREINPDLIDDLLPQTQCGLCGYGACKPYAEALSQGQASINLCPPGGIDTLKKLASLLDQDPEPYFSEMEKKLKPNRVVSIRENECIGCTKCIDACPVDAIIGGAKQMHVIIENECTGCELCIPACPVDCIDLVTLAERITTEEEKKEKANHSRRRYQAREVRKLHEENRKRQALKEQALINKRNYIAAAIARVKAKKI